jgi:hypothetical protein
MGYSVSDVIGGFDNNGNFKRVCNWVSDKNAGIKILAERMDAECDNFALGFANCITRDMKGKPMTDFDFNGNLGLNVETELQYDEGVVNVKTLIHDPTRLFYDISVLPNLITLKNDYLNSSAVNAEEGYHFLFTSSHTMTTPGFVMGFEYSTVLAGIPIIGGDGAPIPGNTIKAGGLYHAVIFMDKLLEPAVKKICILNAFAGSTGAGGRVDTISSDNQYLIVDDDDKVNVVLKVDEDYFNNNLEFVQTVGVKSEDPYIDIEDSDFKNPKIGLKIESVFGSINTTDSKMDIVYSGGETISINAPYAASKNLTDVVSGYPGMLQIAVDQLGDISSADETKINFDCNPFTLQYFNDEVNFNIARGLRIDAANDPGLYAYENLALSSVGGTFVFDGQLPVKFLSIGLDANGDETFSSGRYDISGIYFHVGVGVHVYNATKPLISINGDVSVLHAGIKSLATFVAAQQHIPLIQATNGAKLVIDWEPSQFPTLVDGHIVVSVESGAEVILASMPAMANPSTMFLNDGTGMIRVAGKILSPHSFY